MIQKARWHRNTTRLANYRLLPEKVCLLGVGGDSKGPLGVRMPYRVPDIVTDRNKLGEVGIKPNKALPVEGALLCAGRQQKNLNQTLLLDVEIPQSG